MRGFAGISASKAVLVTSRVAGPMSVWSACAGRTGAVFTSFTTTLKLLVALSGGWALSVTTVVRLFVPGPSASVGVQGIMPLLYR